MRETAASKQIAQRYLRVRESLNERARRLFVASEALAQGYGGISWCRAPPESRVGRLASASQSCARLKRAGRPRWGHARLRKPGAGRKKTTAKDPALLPDLQALVEATTRGDPESPLLWTARSQRNLVAALVAQGHQTSMKMVARLLKELGTACRRIANASKARSIRIGTRSSNTSTKPSVTSSTRTSPSSRWTRRRRSSSAPTRTRAASCAPTGILRTSGCMTSSTTTGRSPPTGCMTCRRSVGQRGDQP